MQFQGLFRRWAGGLVTIGLVATAAAQAQTQAQGSVETQVNVMCSVQAEWCGMIQTTFSRVTGIKVNLIQRSSGEALAQLTAEKANPKTDLWFGGTGDPHLAAAEQDLTVAYKSPSLGRSEEHTSELQSH